MAVQVARRQQAFWKWAWLLGPVTAAFWFPQGWLTVLGYGAASTLMVGALSWWRLTRARRAEERNLEVASSSGRARRVRAHVPGRRDREASRVVATNEPVHNPPKPSRRKRRGRG